VLSKGNWRMSGAAVQISRGTLAALSAGAGGLYLYTNGGAPGVAQVPWARLLRGSEGAYAGYGGYGSAAGQQDVPVFLRPLAEQLGQLSGEVARLRAQQQYGVGYGRQEGVLSGWGWVFFAAGGTAVLVLYARGYGWADVMYVTRAALTSAVEALEEGIENVGTALEAAKDELAVKIGLVEANIDRTRESLEARISEEVGDVKRDLEEVGNDVKGVSRAQEQVHGLVQSIETQIDVIESRMENANDQLSTANRGIYLLCNVVADSMNPNTGAKGSNNRQTRVGSLYEELLAYTRSAMNGFSTSATADPRGDAPDVIETDERHTGLRMLTEERSALQRQPSSALDVVPSFRNLLSSNSFKLRRDVTIISSPSNQSTIS